MYDLRPHTLLYSHLVLLGGLLASLELLEVPAANLHVSTIVVHALSEVLGGSGAVVVVLLVLVGSVGLLRYGFSGRRAAAE